MTAVGDFAATEQRIRPRAVLAAHLRREFREHRTGLIGLLAMVSAFGMVLCLAVDPDWVELRLASTLTLGAAFCAVVLFAPDLAEQRQKTLGFLARGPSGLQAAFWSKVLFLIAVIISFTLIAYVSATLLRAGFTDAPLDIVLARSDVALGFAISATFACAFWMLAVSFWLPRSLLAIPVTALLLALIVLPSWLRLPSWVSGGGTTGNYEDLPMAPILWIHPFLALLAAWWSCVGGRGHGRGPLASAWRGLAVAGVAGAGLFCVADQIAREWHSVRISEWKIERATIGGNGRYAFVRARHRHHSWPAVSVAVDLQTGMTHKIDSDGDVRNLRTLAPPSWPGGNSPLVFHEVKGTHRERIRILDANTLDVLAENPYHQPYRGLEVRCQASLRAESRVVLPDGRRCWMFGRELRTEDGDGYRTLLNSLETYQLGHFWAHGFGVLGTGRDRAKKGVTLAYDLIREKHLEIPADWRRLVCLAAGWLVKTDAHGWQLFDDPTACPRWPNGIRNGDELVWVTQRGRLIVFHPVTRENTDKTFLFRVDVSHGTRERLELPGVGWFDARSRHLLTHVGTTPTGREVFRVNLGSFALTTLRPDANRCTPPVQAKRYAGALSDSTLVTISHDDRLELMDVESGSIRPLPSPR